VTQLKALVAIDSQFAMAWRKLGVAYTTGRFRGGLGDSAYAKAFRFRERLSGLERLRAEGRKNQSVLEDRPRAEQVYREMQQRFPTTFLLYGTTNYANLLGSRRRYAEAESIARQIPPKMVQRYENLYGILLAQGKIVAADSIADEMSRRFPENLSVHRMRALRSRMIGDWETSTRNMLAAVTSASRPSELSFACKLLADEMWMRGRFAETLVAGRKWRAADAARGAIGDAILVDSFRLSLIDVNFRGRPAEGVARLDRAGGPAALDAMSPDQRQYMPMLCTYALAGKATDAAAVLERMPGDLLFLPWALERSGELHAAAGHVRKVLDRYESLITLWNNADPEMQPTVRDLRARVVSLRERLPN